MKRSIFILVKMLLIATLAGLCSSCTGLPGQTKAVATRMVPDSGQGGVTGQIEQAAKLWPEQPVIVYAATFQGDESSGGVYVLEPSLFPQTTVAADGSFQLNNLAPGQYVFVAGPDAEDARAVIDDKQKARVIAVKANQVLELGKLELAP
jgi:hypothetical protein